MIIDFCLASVLFVCPLVCLSSSLRIKQPADLLVKPGQGEANVDCHHGDTNYPYMLWYRHRSAEGQRTMELIGYLYNENPNPEGNFAARFKMGGNSKGRAYLTIANITLTDSAQYFCAARHSVPTAFGVFTKSWRCHHRCTCIKPRLLRQGN